MLGIYILLLVRPLRCKRMNANLFKMEHPVFNLFSIHYSLIVNTIYLVNLYLLKILSLSSKVYGNWSVHLFEQEEKLIEH